MEEKKRETFRIRRESFPVTQQAKDGLKRFNAVKKKIMDAMGGEGLTIPQIAERIGMSRPETLYYVMSMLKFGWVQVLGVDDMDEYYIYQVKK
ncbi:MAG TPA: hypothetical protein ENO16_01040 [Chromatiales bacterium]|nr:hypothetical protein [Chromatiales bacterium]